MRPWIRISLLSLALALTARAQELGVPRAVTAGEAFSIPNDGGQGTFYLIGPASAVKRQVSGEIRVHSEEIEQAGRYTAVVCASGGCSSAGFYVRAAAPARLGLLVHPSRVRVAQPNAISAVTVVFDRFHNLVLPGQTVRFEVTPKNGPALSQNIQSSQGIAWVRMTSAAKEGPTSVGAKVGATEQARVVQQVASDACNLHASAKRVGKQVLVETAPIRDCSGNPVPDGTVVTFTAVGPNGRTTVDAPIKKGIARAQMPIAGQAHISVASGVVLGNELTVSGGGE
jgi:acyl dehydratase